MYSNKYAGCIMIDKDIYLELGEIVLDNLKYKFNFNMQDSERWDLVEKTMERIVRDTGDGRFKQVYDDRPKRKEFIEKFLSYDEVEEFIKSPEVEDIDINSTGPIFVHITDRGFVKTNKSFYSMRYLDFFQKKLLIFAGRSYFSKINDYGLPNIHGRVNIVHSPFGPQITITKSKTLPLSIIQLIERNMLDYKTAAFLWIAVEGMNLRPANMLIVGGPGAGKTTLLNALLSFIPSSDRVIIIEDTLELNTKFMDNFSRLESGEDLSLEHLVKNTLRMRPERIIIGEVRGREAQDMMTAMNIGKYCMGTIHASNTKEAFTRLENVPMNIHPSLINLVDIFVVLRRFRKGSIVQRITEEISETSFMHQKRPLVSVIWKYDYKARRIVEASPFTIFRDKLAEATGLDSENILKEMNIRAKLLYLLSNKNIKTFHEITNFASLYSKDKAQAFNSIGLNEKEVENISLPTRGSS